MRVLFMKNHHVPAGERSRCMYKRGREYEVPDEVGKGVIETKRGKVIADALKGPKAPEHRSAI